MAPRPLLKDRDLREGPTRSSARDDVYRWNAGWCRASRSFLSW